MAFPLPARGRLSAAAFLSVGGARGLVPSLPVGCIEGYYTLPGGGMSTGTRKNEGLLSIRAPVFDTQLPDSADHDGAQKYPAPYRPAVMGMADGLTRRIWTQ